MIARNPSYARYANGVPGGPRNPLGARALYLYNANGHDSAMRIHGTPEPWTVGQAVSNGCTRLVNEHVIHLYDQVPLGTKVVLYPKGDLAGLPGVKPWEEPQPARRRSVPIYESPR